MFCFVLFCFVLFCVHLITPSPRGSVLSAFAREMDGLVSLLASPKIVFVSKRFAPLPFSSSSSSSSSSAPYSEYHVMRMFSSKTVATQPSMTVSALSVGWAYSTPGWARVLTGFKPEGAAHVLKEGDKVGKFTVKRKTVDTIVFEKTGDDYDTLVGLDLIKSSASETRDKYYACVGFQTIPKTSYGTFHVNFVAPVHTMMYKVMLKYSGRYAQDLYAHKYGSGKGNLQQSPIIDAVAQRKAVKAFHKGTADDMGEAEAGRR
uniref:Uncharacterized protein n=2 Tax=Lotharella globosa TaxID=91324 RepID=A0A7S3YV56_9EUKA